MNLFQRTNASATLLVSGATLVGIVTALKDWQESVLAHVTSHPDIWLVVLSILLFRIKSTFDDHQHFAEDIEGKTGHRYLGFVIAIISWLFLGGAGYFVGAPVRSIELFAYSLLISLLWIFVHLHEIRKKHGVSYQVAFVRATREKWAVFNVLYLICIILYVGWPETLIEPNQLWPLWTLIGLVILDMVWSSDSFSG